MSEAASEVAAGASRGRRAFVRPFAWPAVCAVFILGASLLFAYNGVRYTNLTQHELRLIPYLHYDDRVDFGYFYAGATMAWHGDASELYPEPGEWTFYQGDTIFDQPHDSYTLARLLARGNFYNPPALAFLEAPLATMPFREAFWLFSDLGLLALALFFLVGWFYARRVGEFPLLVAGVIAFRPVHETVMLGHTTLFFVLAIGAGFLLVRSQRPVLAGLLLSVLVLKPQWAILPGVFLLVRGEWRALAAMCVAGALIFFVPFFVTGWHTFSNYVEFLRFSATLDLRDAPHMFSWNGFLSKLDGSEIQDGKLVLFADAPPKALVYGLIALTAVPMVIVWLGRDYLLGAAAMVVAMLLVSTHSVWYDWALLSVAALFLVMRSPLMPRGQRVEMWVVLLALYVAASQSIAVVLWPDRHFVEWHSQGFFSMTPVAFGSLIWMASIAVREGTVRLPSMPRRFSGLRGAAGS